MGDDRDGHDDAHRRVDLKAQADAHAVQKAVARERQRREQPNGRMLVVGIFLGAAPVDEHALFGDVEQQKAADQRQHRKNAVDVLLVDLREDFREQIEGDQPHQHACCEPHDEMQPLAVA